MAAVVKPAWLWDQVSGSPRPGRIRIVGDRSTYEEARELADLLASCYEHHWYDMGRDCWFACDRRGLLVMLAVEGQALPDELILPSGPEAPKEPADWLVAAAA